MEGLINKHKNNPDGWFNSPSKNHQDHLKVSQNILIINICIPESCEDQDGRDGRQDGADEQDVCVSHDEHSAGEVRYDELCGCR